MSDQHALMRHTCTSIDETWRHIENVLTSASDPARSNCDHEARPVMTYWKAQVEAQATKYKGYTSKACLLKKVEASGPSASLSPLPRPYRMAKTIPSKHNKVEYWTAPHSAKRRKYRF